MKDKEKIETSEKRQLGVIEGTITKGKLKGKPFKIRLGPTPADSHIVAGGQVLLCTKMVIVLDIENPATNISFDCWMLPEDD